MRIGIVGAENSHSGAIAKTINVDGKVPGCSVDYLWGETAEFAAAAAEKGAIPNIVGNPVEMIGHIDAVVVDHRHGKYHIEAARPFLEAGLPLFIDKPFCYRVEEGVAFLRDAAKRGVPVTSFSTLPVQATFKDLRKEAQDLGPLVGGAFTGPGDLESPYGGVFFYGVHQVEMVLTLFGCEVEAVQVGRNTNCSAAQLFYGSGATVTLHIVKEGWVKFSGSVTGEKGTAHRVIAMDSDPYLAGIEVFTTMFKTGELPRAYDEILATVRILEALEKSAASGNREAVAPAETV